MVLQILRAIFVLLMAAIGYYFLKEQIGVDIYEIPPWLMLMITLAIGVLVVCIDILSPRRKLAIFSGTFLGLIVGMLTSYGFSFIVALLVDRYMPDAKDAQKTPSPVISTSSSRLSSPIWRSALSFKPRMISASSFPTWNSASRPRAPGRSCWTPAF